MRTAVYRIYPGVWNDYVDHDAHVNTHIHDRAAPCTYGASVRLLRSLGAGQVVNSQNAVIGRTCTWSCTVCVAYEAWMLARMLVR